jgi:hypothetical protein
MSSPTPAANGMTIHEATLVSGPSGGVEYGGELTVAEAILRRRQGLDIVVRGPNQRQNRYKAKEIEEAVGPATHHDPHPRAGNFALPHWQQANHNPPGHSFYERGDRKARKRKP